MTEFDLTRLVAALHEHEVRFVIVGGVAVGAHGHIRATKDLDIVPICEPDNIKRLASALVALEARLPAAGGRRFQPARDEGPLHMGANATFETRFGELDVVQRLAGVPSWAELEAAAADSHLEGVPVKVCSLEHLLQMKRASARPQDLLDLEALADA